MLSSETTTPLLSTALAYNTRRQNVYPLRDFCLKRTLSGGKFFWTNNSNNNKDHQNFIQLGTFIPVTSALGKLGQEYCQYETKLGNIIRSCLNKKGSNEANTTPIILYVEAASLRKTVHTLESYIYHLRKHTAQHSQFTSMKWQCICYCSAFKF